MFEQFTAETAPGYAKYSSTFKNDDRCYEVDFFVADTYDEALKAVLDRYLTGEDYSDYDINYSTEGGKYVGVTCRDYDS